MMRRKSKEKIELIIRPESDDNNNNNNTQETNNDSFRKTKKKKKRRTKQENGNKLVVLPKRQKRKESTLQTIIEEDELEDLNNNALSNEKKKRKRRKRRRFFIVIRRFFYRRKAKDQIDARQVLQNEQWHAGWDFLLRSANRTDEERGKPVIVCTEYDTVDCVTSVSRAEDDELLHQYRKRPRRNAVCESTGIERTGLKRVLTYYCHMVYVNKYGLG